jgi:hypothetical protein
MVGGEGSVKLAFDDYGISGRLKEIRKSQRDLLVFEVELVAIQGCLETFRGFNGFQKHPVSFN